MGFYYELSYTVTVPVGSGPVASDLESRILKDAFDYKGISFRVERSTEYMKITLRQSISSVADSSFRVINNHHVIILDTEELLDTGKEKILEEIVIRHPLIDMFHSYLLKQGVTQKPCWIINYIDTLDM